MYITVVNTIKSRSMIKNNQKDESLIRKHRKVEKSFDHHADCLK